MKIYNSYSYGSYGVNAIELYIEPLFANYFYHDQFVNMFFEHYGTNVSIFRTLDRKRPRPSNYSAFLLSPVSIEHIQDSENLHDD